MTASLHPPTHKSSQDSVGLPDIAGRVLRTVTTQILTEQVAWLEETAKRENITPGDILRRAINTEKFFVDQETAHRKILVQDGDRLREVIRR